MKKILIVLLSTSIISCSSFPLTNQWEFSLAGLGGGAVLGHTLSPNEESRGLNSIVFGAVGGAIGFLFHKLFRQKESETTAPSLKENELSPTKEITLPATTETLPDFIKNRLTPIVIETFEEKSSVNENGELSEPHRVWRIKRQPELVPNHTQNPTPTSVQKSNK